MTKVFRELGISLLLWCFCLVPVAEAVDGWGVAAQALGVYAAYRSCLVEMLRIGNNVHAQYASRRQDLEENGEDSNALDVQTVNEVFEQLVVRGAYELKINSLPFVWAVNDSENFNAACYPTNYISVNRALVRGFHCDRDELAAVLAHEMTHGLRQHSARNYAKAMAQYFGLSFLNMAAGALDWNQMAVLTQYSIAKNVTLPSEYEADAGGFWLMTSAGFNPGGGAAAMARMDNYFRYQTQDLLEYKTGDNRGEDLSDHPETELREKRLAKLLTDYSCGHVTVENRRDVYIDGNLFLTAEWDADEFDNTMENAYYIAGGLAKAFHDYATVDEWNFPADDRSAFLNDNQVYGVLQKFTRKAKALKRLRLMVTAAYAADAGGKARASALEQERDAHKWRDKVREETITATGGQVERLYQNADIYSDYGWGKAAVMEADRAMKCPNLQDKATALAIRGRALAVCGDYEAAMADCDQAVALDSSNPYNYLNRADAHHMAGNYEAALADCQAAGAIDAKNPYVYQISAVIYDELGDKEQATANYRRYLELCPRAEDVPEEYRGGKEESR